MKILKTTLYITGAPIRCMLKNPAKSGLIGFVLVFLVIGALSLYQQGQTRVAIKTTCILVSNLAVQGISNTEAGEIIRREALREATPETLKEYKAARERQRPLTSPDCDRIVNNPEAVRGLESDRKVQDVPDKDQQK